MRTVLEMTADIISKFLAPVFGIAGASDSDDDAPEVAAQVAAPDAAVDAPEVVAVDADQEDIIEAIADLYSDVVDEYEPENIPSLLARTKHDLTFERKKAVIASLVEQFEKRVEEFEDNVRNRLTSDERKTLREAKKVIRELAAANPGDQTLINYKQDLRLSSLEARSQRSIPNQVKYALAVSYDAIVTALKAVIAFLEKVGNAIKNGAIATKDAIVACVQAVGNAIKTAAIAVWDFLKFVGSTIKSAAVTTGSAAARAGRFVAGEITRKASDVQHIVAQAIDRADEYVSRKCASALYEASMSVAMHADGIAGNIESREAAHVAKPVTVMAMAPAPVVANPVVKEEIEAILRETPPAP